LAVLLGSDGRSHDVGRDTSSLAGLAGVALTETLGDNDALLADGILALVALQQMLPVIVALLADGATAVLLAAAVADNVGAAI